MANWRLKLARWLINGISENADTHWHLAVAISEPPGPKELQFQVYLGETVDENKLLASTFSVPLWLELRDHMQEAVWRQELDFNRFEEGT